MANNKKETKTKKLKKTKRFQPLSLRERIDIEYDYHYGVSITAIAKKLGRNKSTISREVAGKPRTGIGRYRADVVHSKALARIQNRGNVRILSKNKALQSYVVGKLKLGWSPEQISIRLPHDYTTDKTMRISHESIYQYIYAQIHRGGNGNVKKNGQDLRPYLSRRHKRRATKGMRKVQQEERKKSFPSIIDRPQIVTQRTRVGDWEDDLIISRQSRVCIKSVNERKTGIVFFGKTTDGTAKSGDAVLIRKLESIPSKYRQTLTRDNGAENKDWKTVEQHLKLKVFFAHPYHSWERGSNENLNGLFRRYFPKKTNFAIISYK